MKDAGLLIAAIAVTAASLTTCSTKETAQDEAVADQTEGLSEVFESQQPRANGEPDKAHNNTEPTPTHDARSELDAATPSPEASRHWLAPPPAPPAPTAAAADPEAWADYKYTEWLHGMNTTYREMCGELTDLSVYRACVPDDPHAYITAFSATEISELVITIGPGPWEGGTYDTESIPAADFVAGNVPFHIAKFGSDFDSVTALTPNGDSDMEPYDPILDTYFDHVPLEDMVVEDMVAG